jgi:hypothetical protein
MSVKIIRQNGAITYSRNYKRIRIEFKDGTHMLGFINIHAKFKGNEEQDDLNAYMPVEDVKYKFDRTSDFLKDCHPNEGMITVFEAMYGGNEIHACFVFLHSVKFITEEKEIKSDPEEKAEPQKEDLPESRSGSFLRDRIKRN